MVVQRAELLKSKLEIELRKSKVESPEGTEGISPMVSARRHVYISIFHYFFPAFVEITRMEPEVLTFNIKHHPIWTTKILKDLFDWLKDLKFLIFVVVRAS